MNKSNWQSLTEVAVADGVLKLLLVALVGGDGCHWLTGKGI